MLTATPSIVCVPDRVIGPVVATFTEACGLTPAEMLSTYAFVAAWPLAVGVPTVTGFRNDHVPEIDSLPAFRARSEPSTICDSAIDSAAWCCVTEASVILEDANAPLVTADASI